MIVSLITKKNVSSLSLPQKVRGQYSITDEDNTSIDIEGVNDHWVLKSNKTVKILDKNGKQISGCEISEMSVYPVAVKNKNDNAIVFTEPSTVDRISFRKYVAGRDQTINIGRNPECDICIDNNYVSGRHAVLSFNNGSWFIEDNRSFNGTFVNGKRVEKSKLNIGDTVYIMGVIIIIGKSLIAINDPDRTVHVNSSYLQEYIPQRIVKRDEADEPDFSSIEDDSFYRSPRFKRDIEKATFKFDAPPNKATGDEMPIMMSIGPSMTMGMASMATALYGLSQGNVMSAVTSGFMLCGTILWPVISKTYDKRKKQKKEALRQEQYKNYLERITESLKLERDKQREIIVENSISIIECMQRIKSVSRNLWERSLGQNDFLKLNIGRGTQKLNAEINYPERRFEIERDPLAEELLAICEAPHSIHNVPIAESFYDNNITGIIGKRTDAVSFANGLILQLVSLYSYDELKLVIMYDENVDGPALEYVKWLPHIWNEDRSLRFLAKNINDIKDISAFLDAEVESRKELNDSKIDDITPYYVVFAFSKELSLRAEFLQKIYVSKTNIHFSVITLFDEIKNVPKECSNVIELDGFNGKIYNKDDISGKITEFLPEIYVTQELGEYGKMLSNIHLFKSESAFQLPNVIPFLEMFNVGKIEHLNVLERWRENDPTKSLEAQIGVDTLGDPFMLDLHEKNHGPHGLIAGMTGSGKSEFIMTYILSLAVNYHPNEVAFVLIDYKGGGMAKAFENLPHTAGIITNLDGSAIKRSLISIQSELTRRQGIFAEVSRNSGISNIDIYKYQKMYREGKVNEPLQHLFIISDEFAELKTQQPDFMKQLISAARIGRSLGVHLILATQKPSGVVDDQIWSNARFKACLKVQDKADSMDMLKRPEAAELKETGRFYLQVGYNEMFKLGQSAWSGAPYCPSDKIERQKDDSIEVIDNVGRVVMSLKIDKKRSGPDQKKQTDAITDHLADVARQENIKIRMLWLDPIPAVIYADELKEKYKYSTDGEIDPVIGEIDDPENQSQGLLTVPFVKKGNAAVYGMAGSGKTTFLTTLFYSLITSYSPDEVNLYILDFSSETLTAFSKAPHVGDVVLAHESEKVSNLIKLLSGYVLTRKKLFAEAGGDFSSYNRFSKEKVPAIVVAISNYTAFTELYDEYEGEMLKLTREGTKYGIYFILTATGTNGIRFRMLQNIGQSFALQLSDDTDYSTVLGKTDGLLPSKIKGRGLMKEDKICEFQTAHAFKAENTLHEIRKCCDELAVKYKGTKARRIPVLPEKVDIDFLQPYIDRNSLKIPAGVETASLKISYFDIGSRYISFIQSEGDLYSSFTEMFVTVLSEVMGLDVKVFDAGGVLKLKKENHFTSGKSVSGEIDELFNTVVERHNAIKDAEDTGIALPAYPVKIIVIASLSSLQEALEGERKEKLSLILERGSIKQNIYVVVADSAKAVSNYNFEKWYKNNVSQNDGLWVGRGIGEQYYLKTNKTTPEMREEISRSFGFMVRHGNVVKVKLLSNAEDETDG